MVVQLVRPDKKYLPSVYEAVKEYQSEPARFGVSIVKKMILAVEDNFAHYFQDVENNAAGIGLKPNHVAQTVYWLVDDNQYIGSFALRHSLTPDLKRSGGHIAYQIRPSKQRMGYAYKGLKFCLKEALNRGIKKVLVTCNAENVASYGVMHKVMLEYGGYEDPVFQSDGLTEKRVWIETSKRNFEIRFCLPIGKWWFLSPYAEFLIKMEVDGNVYTFPTVEHYYQAMKFYAFDERFNVIRNLATPDEARLMTKKPEYKINRRADFDTHKFDIMEQGLRAKFMQNPQAAEMLKATGDAVLIKSCEVCYKCGFGEGSGENRMGKILMKIRDELKSNCFHTPSSL